MGSLRALPAKFSKKWRVSEIVAAGLFLTSSSRNLFVAWSALGASTSLPGGKGLSLVGKPDVALDRGEADAEEPSGLGVGHSALVDSLDYLLAEVFGVSLHPSTIACG